MNRKRKWQRYSEKSGKSLELTRGRLTLTRLGFMEIALRKGMMLSLSELHVVDELLQREGASYDKVLTEFRCRRVVLRLRNAIGTDLFQEAVTKALLEISRKHKIDRYSFLIEQLDARKIKLTREERKVLRACFVVTGPQWDAYWDQYHVLGTGYPRIRKTDSMVGDVIRAHAPGKSESIADMIKKHFSRQSGRPLRDK